jgi:hypothetical protein
LPEETVVTPGTWRIFSRYEAGRRKMREMAFRVMRRDDEDDSTPRYHAPTSVRRSPKASTAMATPTTVSVVRSLWRKAFRMMSLRTNMYGLLWSSTGTMQGEEPISPRRHGEQQESQEHSSLRKHVQLFSNDNCSDFVQVSSVSP